MHSTTPRNSFTHQSFSKSHLVALQFNVKVKNLGTTQNVWGKKQAMKKNRPGPFSICTFSLVCIFLLDGWELRNTFKFIMYIRFILFTWTKKIFAPTYHIDTMFLPMFSDEKCSQFGLPPLRSTKKSLIHFIILWY